MIRLKRIIRHILILPIRIYQWVISPLFPSHCNYYPTCSEYSRQAILTHGILRGSVMGAMRVGRCSSRFYGGTDPVPDRFDIVQLRHEYPARSVKRHRTNQQGDHHE